MIFERGARNNSASARVRFERRRGIRGRHRLNYVGDRHAVNRIGDHAQIGRAVRLGEPFDIVRDDLLIGGRRDDEELLVLGVNFDKARVRNELLNRGYEIARWVGSYVVVLKNRVKFRLFFRIEEFEQFLNGAERDLIVRADDERVGRGIVDRRRRGIDRGNLRRQGRVIRAADLPAQNLFIDRIFLRKVGDRLFDDSLFLFGSPDDERLVVVVVGNARGGHKPSDIAHVVRGRIIRSHAVVGIEPFDRIGLKRSYDAVFLKRVDRGEDALGFREFFCRTAQNEPRVNRVVRYL